MRNEVIFDNRGIPDIMVAARIVISEVEKDDVLACVLPAAQPSGSGPHFRL